ncbi:GP46-like surface antigen, putative [Bodo saltans]|uniref:GP46-like surface antigen, putative n=1 Tax=Bodo saltans TaxID=75058 RepID=A0A0S4IVC7_BODSA|nr:GP46-like surface antigen, putative [Bodo saltans]|eukprot:CUG03284.1 GP46-like surface antigen, putative [Bodo saltans]
MCQMFASILIQLVALSFPIPALCSVIEMAALVSLYNATDGPHWHCTHDSAAMQAALWDVTNSSSNCCVWYGIRCDSNQSVIMISLEACGLSGPLRSDLANLTNLATLQLANNKITGSIPVEYASWEHIADFNISFNSLVGELSPLFGKWGASITAFDVCNNFLTGTLPEAFSAWSRIHDFNVSVNSLTGTLPCSYGSWTWLFGFSALGNQLNGSLPVEYSTMGAERNGVYFFMVTNNSLCGSIPAKYSSWTSIYTFAVQYNFLNGTFPAELGSAWKNINIFTARSTSITGTLPLEYGNWTMMETFQVADNPHIYGTLPESYGTSWTVVKSIIIFGTNISGEIPASWGRMTTINVMMLFQNKLSGTLPDSLGNLTKLELLVLALNNFSGTVPFKSWGSLRNVQLIVLQDNPLLSGVVPTNWSSIFVVESVAFFPLPTLFICRSQICGPILAPACDYSCTSSDKISQLAATSSTGLVDLLMSATRTRELPCSAAATGTGDSGHRTATLQQSLSITITSTNNVWVEEGILVASSTIAVNTAATAIVLTGSVFLSDSGSGLGNIQMLSSIMSSPCMCPGASVSAERMNYANSPFADLGPSAVVLGNIGCMVAINALHFLAVVALSKHHRGANSGKSPPISKAVALSIVSSSLRWPGLGLRVSLLFVPGIAKGSVALLSALPNSDNGPHAVSGVVGVVVTLFAIGVLEWFVYRRQVVRACRMKFRHTLPHQYAPVSKSMSAIVLPRGFWGPLDAARRFGQVVNGYTGKYKRWWPLSYLPNIALQFLGGILVSPQSSGCDVIQSVMVVTSLCTALVLLTLRPTRVLLTSFLSATAMLLVAMVTFLGLLCRHDVVDAQVVVVFGVICSVFGLCQSLSAGAVTMAEMYFLRRNGAVSDVDPNATAPPLNAASVRSHRQSSSLFVPLADLFRAHKQTGVGDASYAKRAQTTSTTAAANLCHLITWICRSSKSQKAT